jgi:hypothetical protein
MYVIYDHPRDFPAMFVVRCWRIIDCKAMPDEEPFAVVDSLELARGHIPTGLFRIHRHGTDDPNIVETWL